MLPPCDQSTSDENVLYVLSWIERTASIPAELLTSSADVTARRALIVGHFAPYVAEADADAVWDDWDAGKRAVWTMADGWHVGTAAEGQAWPIGGEV